MPFQPIIGRPMPVARQSFPVEGFRAVELDPLPQHLANAEHLRAVRVVWRFTFGVMLAVDGDPLFGDHAGGQPQPKSEEMADAGMEIERAVRLRAMQENGDG